MKKKTWSIFAVVILLASVTSCSYLKPNYDFDAMIKDYIHYTEVGDTEKAQKLYDKLMEFEDQLTDDQFYRIEGVQN